MEVKEKERNTLELFKWKIQRRLRELFPQLTPPRAAQSLHEDPGRDVLAGQTDLRGFPVPNSLGTTKLGAQRFLMN